MDCEDSYWHKHMDKIHPSLRNYVRNEIRKNDGLCAYAYMFKESPPCRRKIAQVIARRLRYENFGHALLKIGVPTNSEIDDTAYKRMVQNEKWMLKFVTGCSKRYTDYEIMGAVERIQEQFLETHAESMYTRTLGPWKMFPLTVASFDAFAGGKFKKIKSSSSENGDEEPSLCLTQ